MSRMLRAALACVLLAGAFLLAACGGGTSMTQQTASYTVKLTLDTLAVGDRTATVEINDQSGQPVAAERVVLTPTMLSMGMASPEVAAQADGSGRYRGDVLLSMTGDWELDVRVEDGSANETARFTFTVPTQ